MAKRELIEPTPATAVTFRRDARGRFSPTIRSTSEVVAADQRQKAKTSPKQGQEIGAIARGADAVDARSETATG